jgi:hypothetical protein
MHTNVCISEKTDVLMQKKSVFQPKYKRYNDFFIIKKFKKAKKCFFSLFALKKLGRKYANKKTGNFKT